LHFAVTTFIKVNVHTDLYSSVLKFINIQTGTLE